MAQMHYVEAQQSLGAAETIFRVAGHRPAWAGVLLEQSALAVTVDKTLPLQEAQARLRLAERVADPAEARAQLALVQTLDQQLSLPQLHQRWLHQMGRR